MIALVLIFGLVVAAAIAGCKTSRAAYETAPYRVVRAEGKFEIRDYPALTLVETTTAPAPGEVDGGFMRLFRFITGSNQANQKIAMTTPVFMTADGPGQTMAFVMPRDMTPAQLPKPADATVHPRQTPAGRFAVFRFRGGRNSANEAKALGQLQSWMAAAGLKAAGTPVYGYFDPPWTPSFLRRNEVMLRAETGSSG